MLNNGNHFSVQGARSTAVFRLNGSLPFRVRPNVLHQLPGQLVALPCWAPFLHLCELRRIGRGELPPGARILLQQHFQLAGILTAEPVTPSFFGASLNAGPKVNVTGPGGTQSMAFANAAHPGPHGRALRPQPRLRLPGSDSIPAVRPPPDLFRRFSGGRSERPLVA